MQFEFEKFTKDIEKRSAEEASRKTQSLEEVNLDKARRLRDQRYFERWQNRIVWEDRREQ